MKKTLVANTTQIRFTFYNPHNLESLQPITFDYTKATEPMRDYAEVHGWLARLGDNAALARKQPDGSTITVTEQMRRDAVMELVMHYENGATEWNLKASARTQPINPAMAKIAEMRKCTYAEAQAWYNEKLIAEMQAMVDASK